MASSYTIPRNGLEYPGDSRKTLDLLSQLPRSHYEFRPGPRLVKKVVSTWVDTDESGTYDPEGKREVAPPPKRSRESWSEADKAADDGQPKKPRPNSWLRGRQQGESLLVTFGFKSDKGKATVGTYIDSTSDQRSSCSSEEHRKTLEAEASGTEMSSLRTALAIRPYPIRTRRISGVSKPSQSTSTLDLSDFSLGHPEARGCKACFELGISCPLLEDGSTYPCINCVEDDCDCELIIPPARKRACENCRKSRVKCSYREGGDHSLPCENCQHKGQKCFAGAENSSRKPLLEAARFKPTPERPFVTCMPCRKKKKWCSLRTRGTEPPCNGCLRNGVECSFEKAEKYNDQAVQQENKTQTTRAPPEIQPPTLIPDATRECGVGMIIKTAFAHPITFNHNPVGGGSDPCHWCDAAAFGIIGNGEVEVEVIRRQGGRGYTEISGGHASRGVEPSRMCGICTMERMLICVCEGHTIQPLSGRNPEDFDFEGAFQELLSDVGSQGASRGLWCSVCPSPAFFECCTPQELDLQIDEIIQALPETSGCGLLLCETCEQLLASQYGGDLQAMISNAEANIRDFPAGLRADVSFLLDSGELMQRMRAEIMAAEENVKENV